MNASDMRWKQRLLNLEKSLGALNEALLLTEPDYAQKAGIIQFFEMTFELSWNVMKDYLTEQGFQDVLSPRQSIKQAFEAGLIQNGQLWLLALEDRNLTTHAYDEETADEIVRDIREKYNPLFNIFFTRMKNESE
ncbi:MAG: nucleotidyltransferase [Ignavibacteriota bacterium]